VTAGFLRNLIFIFLATIVVCAALPSKLLSQISYNPVSMGLGGGGTSYITDYEALFINPANLQIREKNHRVQMTLGESGAYFDTPLRINDGRERISLFVDTFRMPIPDDYMFEADERQLLLERYYNGNKTTRELRSGSVINWLGIKWYGKERSYAFAVRTRQSSRYAVGRGFYDPQPVESNELQVIDRSLTHRYQMLHEFSFGYSESFSFLSGLFPRTAQFIIGIAPKVVVSGSDYSTRFSDRYTRESADAPWLRESSFSYESSGIFTDYADRLAAGGNPIDEFGRIKAGRSARPYRCRCGN
jgi:hypothetical protein